MKVQKQMNFFFCNIQMFWDALVYNAHCEYKCHGNF